MNRIAPTVTSLPAARPCPALVGADGAGAARGLDLSKLENVRTANGKTLARCPACAESGGDGSGEHLVIDAIGRFACVMFSGLDGTEHRKRIFALAGYCVIDV